MAGRDRASRQGEPGHAIGRDTIAASLHSCRADLHALLDTATPEQLRARSDGTKWTNEQLLFHMVFGFPIVRRLLPLVRFISTLPGWVGRGFVWFLDSGRVSFHWVNYAGTCVGPVR